MSECQKYEDRFVDALYGELDSSNQEAFDAHLKECGRCRELHSAMQKTLQTMDRRERLEPSPEYWEQYDESLKKRLAEAAEVMKPKVVQWQPLRRIPRWALKAAAAFILVGVGVLIGRYYQSTTVIVDGPVQRVSMDPETKRFLERSQILLIGIVNLEPEEDGSYPTDLAVQKKVSRDLIQEASVIKANLKGPDKRRLNELVSDLELILLQIANLEAENDQPEIELVKSGVDRKGVLFKINLEQMRMSGAAGNEPEHKKGSREKKL